MSLGVEFKSLVASYNFFPTLAPCLPLKMGTLSFFFCLSAALPPLQWVTLPLGP